MKILFSIFTIFIINNVYAENDWFVGGLIGTTSIDTGVTNVTGANLDEGDKGISLILGKQINDRFSIEGFYFDAGEASLVGDTGDTFRFNNVNYEFTASGSIKLTATSMGFASKIYGTLSDNLFTFIKVGLHQWDSEATTASATGQSTVDDDGTDLVLGIGLDYKLNDSIHLIGGYDKLDYDDDSVTFINFGLRYFIN